MARTADTIAIYSRKSRYTGKGESIGNQIDLCREYIRTHYGDAAAEQEDVLEYEGYSGGNLSRQELKKIKKSFSKDETVLKEISDSIGKGELITLLGSSGCGKTTTLRIIAGLETPDSGQVFLDGKDVTDLAPEARDVNTVFQNYALFPHMTVRQNILCGFKWEKRREIREQKYRDILKLLQLEELQKHRPHQLSGGQAQRTALARMLVYEPHLLLLDEPFSALDSHLREKLQMELRELLKRYGRDVLLVTHSRDEAYHM